MVELPLRLSPTVDAIDAHYAKHQDTRPVRALTARLLSLTCDRAGWYAFRWAHPPKQFPGSIVRSNFSRTEAMNELVGALSDVGVKVERADPKTFVQREGTAAGGHYRQKIAGIATGILEAPKTPHLVYADQQSSKAFAQILKHGIGVAKPDRLVALQMGMHLFSLTRAFYLVRNKDTDELHAERVDYDAAHALTLTAKAERLRDSSEPPTRVSDDPKWFECKFCPAFDVCHVGEFAQRNCRTCIHSAWVDGGGWWCERHNIDLSIDLQAAGCPHHLYLPGLVPGEQVDADPEAETVTYKLARGDQFVDGAERAAS